MKRADTLKMNYEFRRVYKKGRSGVSPFVVVYARPNRLGRNRLGITVSTRLGKAVKRNRVRRRLREIYRLSRLRQGYDIVLVARIRAVTSTYAELANAFRRVCGKLGLLEAAEASPKRGAPERTAPAARDTASERTAPAEGAEP